MRAAQDLSIRVSWSPFSVFGAASDARKPCGNSADFNANGYLAANNSRPLGLLSARNVKENPEHQPVTY